MTTALPAIVDDGTDLDSEAWWLPSQDEHRE